MLHCDKWVGVRSAAEAAATEVVRKLNKHAVKATLPSEPALAPVLGSLFQVRWLQTE